MEKTFAVTREKMIALLATLVLAMGLSMGPLAATALAVVDPATNESTGSITVNGLAEGDTAQAYRIIETTIDADTNQVVHRFASGISYNDDADGGLAAFLQLSGEDLKQAVEKLAVQAKREGITARTAQANASGTAVVTGAPMGQYLVLVKPGDKSEAKTVYQVTTVNLTPERSATGTYKLDDATIAEVKHEDLTIPKTVYDPATDTQATTTDGYQNGDELTFTLSPTVPVYPTDTENTQYINKKFIVGDSMTSGLEFSDDQLSAITVKDADGQNLPAGAYSIAKEGNGFTINFNYDMIADLAGTKLAITYKATLNAPLESADGVETNTATLEYNRNPFDDSTSDTVTTEVKDYSFGIYLKKVGPDGEPLANATFEVKDADGNSIGTFTTNGEGYGGLNGLKEAGEYTLHETVVPAGYVAVTDFKVTVSKASATGDNPGSTIVESNYLDAGTIKDAKQPDLPVTGGMGTMALTAIGVLLAVACAAMVVRYRRSLRD